MHTCAQLLPHPRSGVSATADLPANPLHRSRHADRRFSCCMWLRSSSSLLMLVASLTLCRRQALLIPPSRIAYYGRPFSAFSLYDSRRPRGPSASSPSSSSASSSSRAQTGTFRQRSNTLAPSQIDPIKLMTASATMDPSVPAVRGVGAKQGDANGTVASGTIMQRDSEARMVSDLEACGRRLREGQLVAFPTETVYGLGCHALDEKAVLKVFEAKERPLSDPLIVHVLDADDAFELWDVSKDNKDSDSNSVKHVLAALCGEFWPGPLTLVAPANLSRVPSCITANTGFVACRSPSHPLARELLRHAQVPLGAPSANKFGHVSPTTALHVYDDLKDEDVWIVPDNSVTQRVNGDVGGGCDVGVESTVAKVEKGDDGQIRIQVLRQGKVSAHELQTCLAQTHLPNAVVETVHRSTSEGAVNVAPGQTLRHYSPNVPSFLVSANVLRQQPFSPTSRQRDVLQQTVIVDYGGRLSGWKGDVQAYRDLSPREDSAEAARAIFETLRWAEQQPAARRILFPQLSAEKHDDNDAAKDRRQRDSLFLAVQDRLTRAASGVVISSLDDL